VLAGHRPGELDAMLVPASSAAIVKALPVGDVAGVLRQRPDVRGRAAPGRRQARIGVAEADLFPRISFSGFIGFIAGDFMVWSTATTRPGRPRRR
jgi:outer membrane protein TolC